MQKQFIFGVLRTLTLFCFCSVYANFVVTSGHFSIRPASGDAVGASPEAVSSHFMGQQTFNIFLATLLCCFSSTAQKMKKEFWGVPMTCVTDSSSITFDTIINLKRATPTGQGPYPKNPVYKYRDCSSAPDYIEFVQFWPTQIILNFKKKTYFFLHSPRPNDPKIKYGENGFTVAYDFDHGTLTYDKRKQLLTLTSTKNTWTKTYKISYSRQKDILTLQFKNNY
jgi:hypothetical protein